MLLGTLFFLVCDFFEGNGYFFSFFSFELLTHFEENCTIGFCLSLR